MIWDSIVLKVFTHTIGGYLIADLPKPFLQQFTQPHVQAITLFLIFLMNGVFTMRDNLLFSVFKTLLAVAVIQGAKYGLRAIYGDERENIYTDTRER